MLAFDDASLQPLSQPFWSKILFQAIFSLLGYINSGCYILLSLKYKGGSKKLHMYMIFMYVAAKTLIFSDSKYNYII